MAQTTPEEVIALWIGGDAPSVESLEPWIEAAERTVRGAVPGIMDRLADADTFANFSFVVAQMVIRVFRNPEGVRTVQESAGALSLSRTAGGEQPGALWLTNAELALLSPSKASGRAFYVDLMPGS